VHRFDGDVDPPLGRYDRMKLDASGAPLAISQVMTTGVPGEAVDVDAELDRSEGGDAAEDPAIVKEGPPNWKKFPA
jgi:hypothetical protein